MGDINNHPCSLNSDPKSIENSTPSYCGEMISRSICTEAATETLCREYIDECIEQTDSPSTTYELHPQGQKAVTGLATIVDCVKNGFQLARLLKAPPIRTMNECGEPIDLHPFVAKLGREIPGLRSVQMYSEHLDTNGGKIYVLTYKTDQGQFLYSASTTKKSPPSDSDRQDALNVLLNSANRKKPIPNLETIRHTSFPYPPFGDQPPSVATAQTMENYGLFDRATHISIALMLAETSLSPEKVTYLQGPSGQGYQISIIVYNRGFETPMRFKTIEGRNVEQVVKKILEPLLKP